MVTFIGCSGYYYREWKGQFYPSDIPSTRWLRYYTEHFNTIEINATFYRMPTLKSLGKWYNDTPDDFVFTVKAPRLFTHYRRMKGILEEQTAFYETCFSALKSKLRCVLYQFPATVKYSEQMLEALMSLSNIPVLHAIEFRDISWWREDVYKALGCSGIARVDMLIDSKTGKVYFNEVNPLPGGLYAHNWAKAGISNVDLVQKLIDFAEERWRARQKLATSFSTNYLKQF